MPAALQIRTFGGLRITLDGQPLPAFPTRKVEALLVYLACVGRPCPREVLANLLWDERTQAQAQSNLRAALSRLRQRLPDHLEIDRYHLALRRQTLWLDASALVEALATVHAAAATEPSVQRLEEGLRLYQGDFMAGFALRGSRGFDDWLLLEREQVRRRVVEALAWLAGWHADRGRFTEALAHAHRLLTLDSLDEAGQRQLMRLLALSGDRSQALAQYAECVHLLETELGSPPAAETEALYQQIKLGQLGPSEPAGPGERAQAGAAAAGPEAAPSLVPLINPLPQEVYSRYVGQVGRQTQIQQAMAEQARLITIYGRAGVGKTALACKVIGDIRRQPLAPGAAGSGLAGIVALSARDDSLRLERVLSDVGRLLGVPAQRVLQAVAHNPALPAQQKAAVLLEQLQGQRVLLLLDNLETLQDPATGQLLDPDLRTFIETTLAASSDLCLLVTSREPLALPRPLMTWERSVALDDGLPPNEAMALLRAFDPGGQAGLREATPDLLRRLAERVHGFPRALEALAGLLLEDPLLRPEDLLAGGALFEQEVTATVVQQAIERLSPEGQRVLGALAVFGQPAPLAAVEYLLAPSLPLSPPALRALVARLVRTFFVRYDGTTRNLHLHPLDQAYCYERIPEGDASGKAYTRRALHGRAAEWHARQRPPKETWRRLEDLAHPLAEFRHSVAAGAPDRAAEVLLAIDRDHLWEWGQYALLAEMYRQLEGRLSDERLARACRRRQAWMAWPDALALAATFERNLVEAREAGDPAAEAGALDDLAQNARFQGDHARARDLHAQALALFRQVGDVRGEAEALGGLGQVYGLFGDHRQAIAVIEQALVIYRELGLGPNAGFALFSLGMGHLYLGELDQASACMAKSSETYEAASSPIGALQPQALLGVLYAMQGRLEDGFSLLEANLDLARRMHSFLGVMMTSISLGSAQLMAGDTAGAAARLRPLLDRAVQSHNYGGEALIRHFLSIALLLLGEIGPAQAVHAGLRPAISPRQAVTQSGVQGIIEFRLGRRQVALARFREVLHFWQGAATDDDHSDLFYWRALALAGLARLDEGDEQAADAAYAEAERRLPAPGIRQLHRQLLRALLK